MRVNSGVGVVDDLAEMFGVRVSDVGYAWVVPDGPSWWLN